MHFCCGRYNIDYFGRGSLQNSLLFANSNTVISALWIYVSYAMGKDRKMKTVPSKSVLAICVFTGIMCILKVFLYPTYSEPDGIILLL
jgi:hypothetical protein